MDRIAATIAVLLALLLPIPGATQDRVVPRSAPSIVLTSPSANTFFAEDLTPSVLLSASVASADYPIAHVVFYMCETRAGTCYSSSDVVADIAAPPYEYRWTPPRFPSQTTINRTYQTWATAVNSAGQAQTSSFVPFTVVQPPPPPSINLVVPKWESGYVTPAAPVLYATAVAGDTLPASTIARVDFLDGATVIGSVAAPNSVPSGYAFVWQNAPTGIHLVSARAIDSLGYSTTSGQVTVYIVDPDPPPQVTLTSPATGQIFVPPNSVPLAATAMSTLGVIQRVEFVTRDLLIGTSFSPPYAMSWSNPPPGTFAIVARAYDDIGVAAASPAAYIQVLPKARAPAVVLTAPAPGASIASGAPLAMGATAMSPDGSVGRVDFFAGDTLLGSAATSPYLFTWPNPASGPQSLVARAVDLQGNVGVSAAVEIQVVNNRPPVVTLTSPANGSQFTAPASIALAATATDVDGSVAKVEFFAGATKVAAATAAPFTATWPNVPAGSYALTAIATDNVGATTTSATANILVSAPPPSVSLTAPRSGATYAPGQSIVVTAAASAPQRSISRVEFYSDGALITVTQVPGGPSAINVDLTWTNATSGVHLLSAKVIATDGVSATSPGVNVTVSDLAVSVVEPYVGQVYQSPGQIRITASAQQTGGQIAQVDFFGDGVLLGSSVAPPYSILWTPVAAGAHTVRAQVRDATGLSATSPSIDVSVVASPTLQVDAGIDGSSVADDNAYVSGIVTAPENSAVVVNGQAAALDQSGHFFANNVQLAPGSNTVTLVLNTLEGAPVSKTITLNSNGAAPFAVTLDSQEGLAPFTTAVTVRNRGNVAFQRIELDLNDDGSPEKILPSAGDGKVVQALTYNNPGLYTLRVTVYDATNAVMYQTKRKIRVYAPVELGLRVVNVYKNMVNQMLANNPTGALRYFSGDAQAKYAGIFNNLASSLPAVATQLGVLVDGVVSNQFTELTLARDSAAGRQAYVVHLIRGADGIWRIESM